MTKSFEGEKFRVCWVHQVYEEKFRDFFSITTFIHRGFPILQNRYERFNESFGSSSEFSLKLSLAYSEMDESTLLTRVCRFHAFQ